MGEFASELRRRVLVAEQSLLAARGDGDDYLESVHTGELESLHRLAHDHGIALARSLPEQRTAADAVPGPAETLRTASAAATPR